MAHHGLPVIAIIGNDSSMSQIERGQASLGSSVGARLRPRRYELVAEGYGGIGMAISEEDQIDRVLRAARRVALAERKPVCINARIAPPNFRSGSISV